MRNAIIIPCYNEAERLPKDKFSEFLESPECHHIVCFVNDGSSDNTADMLDDFHAQYPDKTHVIHLAKNSGKAEAVRQGSLAMAEDPDIRLVGFMDADLSTDFDDYLRLETELLRQKKYLVFGSRKKTESNHISRTSVRHFLSNMVKMVIRLILRLPIHDTQCGAKVMDADLVFPLFGQKFMSRWLFDVEVFIRLRKMIGRKEVMKMILELPLERWVHVEGSKISLVDSLKVPSALLAIAFAYEMKPIMASLGVVAASGAAAFGLRIPV